jgi:HK97 gp10 family phage protein
MATMGIQIDGFDRILKELDRLEADTKEVAEKALKKTFDIVQKKTESGMQKQNLPAKGRYDSGETRKAIIQRPEVSWSGDTASVDVGFDLKQDAGFVSIFLMHGTPKMKPDKKLYDAFYAKKTKDEIIQAQEDIYYSEIARLMGE